MDAKVEIGRSLSSPIHFISAHCQIKTEDGQWRRFELWTDQIAVLRTFISKKRVVVLKARQLGLTWLALCYALWLLLFKPGVTVLVYSLRDDEAKDALKRLKNVYERLPDYLKCLGVKQDDAHVWELSNGSTVRALPTSAGDSYTAGLVLIDEADLVGHDLGGVLSRAQPTIDAGGQLFLVSRSNKKEPGTPFKAIYRAAKEGDVAWAPIFLPWYSRPGRTQAWYEAEKASDYNVNGSYDYIHENYPSTDFEALAPSSLDKRIPADWLQQCYSPTKEMPTPLRVQHMVGLKVYREPLANSRYVIGVDPAEGNPNSDDSALVVLEQFTGEEVASFAAKVAPRRLAEFADVLGQFFNNAALMVERNNHGHVVLAWLDENSRLPVLPGLDNKPGWLENRKSKTILYDYAADCCRDHVTTIHTVKAFFQLQSIDGEKLKAPEGEYDDLAIAYALALMGARQSHYGEIGRVDHAAVQKLLEKNPLGAMLGNKRPFGYKEGDERRR